MRGQGAPVVLKLYPGATHAFNMPRFHGSGSEGRPVTFQGHTMVYDAQATEEAKATLKTFLDQHLRDIPTTAATEPHH